MNEIYKEDLINDAVADINSEYWGQFTPVGREDWLRKFAEQLIEAAKKEERAQVIADLAANPNG